MLKPTLTLTLLTAVTAISARAQDADFGFSLPVTLSGGAMYTQRTQFGDPSESAGTGGFRAMFYPTVKLGSHWFGYAAVQVRLAPYFYYDSYDPEHEFYTNVLQAFLGYSFTAGKITTVVKAGRLSSAFGSFPLHYDDAENPLLDQPLSYITDLPINTKQLPCGVGDLTSQYYGGGAFGCGGSYGRQVGLTPVTLYGLPGVEADVSGYGFDGRAQITSGSPASPQKFLYANEYAQWTLGGGYTIRHGFRVGVSGFRGPYLDQSVEYLLPPGTSLRTFPASAVGVDVQWAHGRWSLSGEWQRFRFDSPNFVEGPSIQSTYGEAKTVLTPRFYVAGRAGWFRPGSVEDKQGYSASQFAPNIASYELGGGFWLNRHQLLKASYEWLNIEHLTGTRTNVFGFQLVTSFRPVNWAFR